MYFNTVVVSLGGVVETHVALVTLVRLLAGANRVSIGR